VQAGVNLGEEGVAEVDDMYHDALDGLDGFSHAWLLTWLGGPAMPRAAVELHQRAFPRPGEPPMGIFADSVVSGQVEPRDVRRRIPG